MISTLNKKQLLEQILNAVDLSGWRSIVLDDNKPFHLRIFRNDEKGFNVNIYIWNCTHGGGSARAKDEYRVQLTSVVPNLVAGESTILLGWHGGYGVFVAFDMTKHDGQDSSSPSIQIKEDTLQNAHAHAFAIYRRSNSEIAVAFRPEFLVDYILNAASLHKTGAASTDMSLLNHLDTLTDAEIGTVTNNERKIVLAQIARKYRASDFRKRVLGAYEHHCAACGVQLALVDAAHIIPVAATTSNDETANGVALCKLHHAAFDRNLLSFDEKYKIEISDAEVARLMDVNLVGGLKEFKANLRTAILLPTDRRDYPKLAYIKEARSVRNWAI